MNVSDQPVTWEKGATVSILDQVNVMAPMTPDTQTAPNSTYKMGLLAAIDGDLQPADMETLSHLIDEFEDVFFERDCDLASTNIVAHSIGTGDDKPIRQPLRRHPLPHLLAIREQTIEMLRQDINKPAVREWTSNVVLVKNDGSLMFCIDYRRLNEASRKIMYPLPCLESCLDAIAGAKWFSTFDLKAGYHQVKMNPAMVEKTTFISREEPLN